MNTVILVSGLSPSDALVAATAARAALPASLVNAATITIFGVLRSEIIRGTLAAAAGSNGNGQGNANNNNGNGNGPFGTGSEGGGGGSSGYRQPT